jgi:hypothetical protein
MQKNCNYWPGNQAPLKKHIYIIVEVPDLTDELKI